MEPIPVHIDSDTIPVDPRRIMDFPDMAGREGDSYTLELIESLIDRCREVFSPESVFLPQKVPLQLFNMGKVLDNMLMDSEYYVFFIASAGPGPEKMARDFLQEGSYLEGYLCDLIASRLAEGVAEKVHVAIRQYADSRDMLVTNRYSPGYCSWDVAEQFGLFGLFGENTCGVSLSQSALMTPIKSVSGVVGMGKEVKYRDYSCENCKQKDCIYRQQRAEPK